MHLGLKLIQTLAGVNIHLGDVIAIISWSDRALTALNSETPKSAQFLQTRNYSLYTHTARADIDFP